MIDDKSAASSGYQIGDTVRVVTSGAQPSVTGTLVGTIRFGQTGNTSGATLALFDTPTAQDLYLRGANAFSDVAVTGDGSVDTIALRDEVRAILQPGYEAVDGEALAQETQNSLQSVR